jgi:quercetin dioxygenase-like cupin family protein
MLALHPECSADAGDGLTARPVRDEPLSQTALDGGWTMSDHIPDQVGTELLFENDRVRVWDMTLQPGQASPAHRHPRDDLFVQVTPGKIEVHADGRAPSTSETDDGFVEYTEVGSGIAHRIVNRAETPYREILVEFKGPSRAAAPRQPQTNGRERRARG